MSNQNQTNTCIVCVATENDIPLISISYKEQRTWTCFACLPLLLHGKKNIDDYF
ncbi:MAG: hypothetical protein ACW97Z_00690 [Candidatus Hodarchaeales archaeon]|jgi:hypothetical protein